MKKTNLFVKISAWIGIIAIVLSILWVGFLALFQQWYYQAEQAPLTVDELQKMLQNSQQQPSIGDGGVFTPDMISIDPVWEEDWDIWE